MPVILATVSLTSGPLATHLLCYENFPRKWISEDRKELPVGRRESKATETSDQRRSAGV